MQSKTCPLIGQYVYLNDNELVGIIEQHQTPQYHYENLPMNFLQ